MNGLDMQTHIEKSTLRNRGFTLLELMIVVAVVAILAVIGYPTYLDQRIKGNRAAAKSHVMTLAAREEQIMLDRRAYMAAANNTAIAATPGLLALPANVSDFYDIAITVNNAATPPTFQISAAPRATTYQAGDGNLVLNSDGTKTGKW